MSDQTGELDRSVEDPKHFRQTVDFVKDKIIFDAHLYSHRLRAKTVWKLRELVRQYPIHLPLFMEIESNLWLQWANTPSERRSALRKAEELKQQTIRLYNNLILEFVLSILRQKIISNKDKNRAISFLESLKNFLDRIPA